MNGWVVDTSLVMSWCLPDEGSELADRFFGALQPTTSLRVPGLFWYEAAQVLSAAKARGRLGEREAEWVPGLLSALPLETSAPVPADLRRLNDLANETGLSAYDAAYLDLALRMGCGLATCDRRLSKVAAAQGVPVFQGDLRGGAAS